MWTRTPQEAYDWPYDYDAQETFLAEASSLLNVALSAFNELNMKFHREDRSLSKALWLLHFDALDALRECAALLRENRPHTASRLFRDIYETLDIAAYFAEGSRESERDLAKWYQDKVFTHGTYREFLKRQGNAALADLKAAEYQNLSKFAHRSYLVLCQSYGAGMGDLLWHDNASRAKGDRPIPQIAAQYMAALAQFVRIFIIRVQKYGAVSASALVAAAVTLLGTV
jgi:hypothetical protein